MKREKSSEQGDSCRKPQLGRGNLKDAFCTSLLGRLTYIEIRKPRQGQSYSKSEKILLQTKGQRFYFPVYNIGSYFLHL